MLAIIWFKKASTPGHVLRGRCAPLSASCDQSLWSDNAGGDPPDIAPPLPHLRLNWKLAILGLLLTCLAASCNFNMLLISGVEPNPGPTKSNAAADSTAADAKMQDKRNALKMVIEPCNSQ